MVFLLFERKYALNRLLILFLQESTLQQHMQQQLVRLQSWPEDHVRGDFRAPIRNRAGPYLTEQSNSPTILKHTQITTTRTKKFILSKVLWASQCLFPQGAGMATMKLWCVENCHAVTSLDKFGVFAELLIGARLSKRDVCRNACRYPSSWYHWKHPKLKDDPKQRQNSPVHLE